MHEGSRGGMAQSHSGYRSSIWATRSEIDHRMLHLFQESVQEQGAIAISYSRELSLRKSYTL